MCGIFGVYSLLNEYIDGSVVIRALAVMRERGTRHGAGVAFYAPFGGVSSRPAGTSGQDSCSAPPGVGASRRCAP